MNKIKRLLLLLLTFALLLGALACFAGCDKDKGKEETTTDDGLTNETEDGWPDDLPPDLKFENEEIMFLIAEPSANKGGTFSERSIAIEGYTIGDVGYNTVDEAVYYRNLNVEDRLGVIITPWALQDAIIKSALRTDLLSGASQYDVLCGYQAHDISMASEGMLLNLNVLDQYNADYIDIGKDYWGKEYSEAISYNNAMYWITGDLSLRYLGGMYCTFVNLTLYEDAIKKTWGDIYTLVDNKGWNLDVMAQMIEQVYVNNGTDTGNIDEGDTLGFVLEPNDMLDGMAIGAGVRFSMVNEDSGEITIALLDNSYNANAFGFIDEMYDILVNNNKGSIYFEKHNHSATAMGLFSQGNVLFTHDKVYQAEIYLTEMENYGIIPSPMLNEEQGEYRTGIHDGCQLFGIYSKSSQISAAVATLEAMASMGAETVATAYFDEALKYRYTRDPDSARMIDLIRDSVYIDFAFAWGNSLGSVHNFFRSTVISASTNNTFKKYGNVWKANLSTLLTALVEQSGVPSE